MTAVTICRDARGWFTAVLAMVLFGWPGLLFASESVDVPVGHWSYERVERLASQGLCAGLGLGMRPVSRGWMADRIAEALQVVREGEKEWAFSPETAYRIEEDLLRLSREFAPELRDKGVPLAQEGTERQIGQSFEWKQMRFYGEWVSENIFTRFGRENTTSLLENSRGFRLRDGFNGRWSFPSWVGAGDWLGITFHPAVRITADDSDTDLDFEEVSAKLAHRNVELKAGELNFWWGPGYHGELLLTDNTRPLPGFSLRSKREFEFPWKLKVLGKWQAQLFGARLEEKRDVKHPFLSGYRLEWAKWKRFVAAASHTIVWGGAGEDEGLDTFFKVLDFTKAGAQYERPDHLFGADARLFLPELSRWLKVSTGLELYGGFFAGDTRGFYIPARPSYVGGFVLSDFLSIPKLDFRFEGAQTDSSAYEHHVYTSGTRFKNEFIGHHIGADADDFFIRMTKAFSFQDRPFVLGAQFDRERQGVSGAALSFGQTPQIKNEIQFDLTHQVTERIEVTVFYQFEDLNNFQGSTGIDSHNHIVFVATRLRL